MSINEAYIFFYRRTKNVLYNIPQQVKLHMPNGIIFPFPYTRSNYMSTIDFNQALINARPLVLAVIHRTGIKDRATAEDVAQNAFIKAWQSAEKESTAFRSESKVSSWLCSIAKNAAIDHMRKHHKMVMLGDKAIPEKASYKYNPESNMLKAERNTAIESSVQQAIEKLSAKHKEVITLYHLDNLSYEEIAAKLGIPKGSVMSRLFHARKKMRSLLK